MIKKSLFKKITALALATCLATSPAVIYAADDAEAVFVEQETVTTDEASSDEGYAEEVFTEDVNEEEKIEETVTEEPEFVGDDVAIEENEPVFVQEDSVVTEDSATEEVAAADEVAYAEEPYGVDDETMEILEGGNDVIVNEPEVASDNVSYASLGTYYFPANEAPSINTILHDSYASIPTLTEAPTLSSGDSSSFEFGNTGGSYNAYTVGVKDSITPSRNYLSTTLTVKYTDPLGTAVTDTITLNAYYEASVAQSSTSYTYYATLDAAIQQANDKTVRLERDVELITPQSISGTVTLQLNGHKITNKEGSTVDPLLNVSGSLIVISQHTTTKNIEAVINGGTISGYVALLTVNPQENNGNDTLKLDIPENTTARFKGNAAAVAAINLDTRVVVTMKGGLYSSDPSSTTDKVSYKKYTDSAEFPDTSKGVTEEISNSKSLVYTGYYAVKNTASGTKDDYPFKIGTTVVASIETQPAGGAATTTYYETFIDAVGAAAGVDAIKLLADCGSYTLSEYETLIVNNPEGKTLTVSAPTGKQLKTAVDGYVTTYTVAEKETVGDITIEKEDDTKKDLQLTEIAIDDTLKNALANDVDSVIGTLPQDKQPLAVEKKVTVEFKGEIKNISEGTVTFTVDPYMTIELLDAQGQSLKKTQPEIIDNSKLVGTDFTFKLYLPSGTFKKDDMAKVVHINNDGSSTTEYQLVDEDARGVFVEITTDHFSDFQISNTQKRKVTVNLSNVDKVVLSYNNQTETIKVNGGSIEVPNGISLKVEAAPTSGYKISSIKYSTTGTSGSDMSSGGTISVYEDTTITATATKSSSGSTGGTTTTTYTYKLTLSSNPTGATLTGAGSYSYTSGSAAPTATATASDMEGYTFTGWQENGTTVSTSKSYSVVMNKDRNLVAVYTKAEPTSAEAFKAEVAALPDATKATSENRKAVDKALADYAALPAADKTKADVVAAKKTLDGINDAVTADEVADKIEALPASPKLDDKAAVEAADKAYKALTDAQKKLVPAKDVTALENAVKAIEQAEADKQKADAVDKLIKALPDKPTLADKEQVEAADKAYKALTDAQKSYIPTADQEKLKAAVKAIEDAEKEKEAADKAAADAVKKMIDDLPAVADVKPENKSSVDAVQKQYDKLTEDQKALVPQAEKDKLAALQKALGGDDQKVAEQFTAAVNAVPGNKAGEGKGLLDKATAIYQTMTDAQKALVKPDTMNLYNEEVEAFKKGRKFRSGDGYYKVLSNGDVTYLYPADKDVTGIVVPNQVKKGKFMFKDREGY